MFEVHVVHSASNPAYAAQLDEMFRQRYDVFVRILKWDIPGTDHQSGREMDQFDGPDTVYLLVLEDGAVLGASRMLPTTGPNMMRDVFPDLCKDGPPASGQVWEWSRGHVKPDEPHQVRSKVLDHIFASGYEFALGWGIGFLTAQINASEFPRWLKRGLVVDLLGPPVRYWYGSEIVALKHRITPATMARVRKETGLHRGVLRYPYGLEAGLQPSPRVSALPAEDAESPLAKRGCVLNKSGPLRYSRWAATEKGHSVASSRGVVSARLAESRDVCGRPYDHHRRGLRAGL